MIEAGRSYKIIGEDNLESIYHRALCENRKLLPKEQTVRFKVNKVWAKDWVSGDFECCPTGNSINIHTSRLNCRDDKYTSLSLPHAYDLSKSISLFSKRNGVTKIAVVGCGGTGSWVIKDLVRLVCAFNEQKTNECRDCRIALAFIDGDRVEKKNTIRQNFINRDIGKYKSEVLATRYGKAYGLSIEFVTDYVRDREVLINLNPSVILGCVDNDPTRKIIEGYIKNRNNIVWIDSGNEKSSGQVVVTVQPNYYCGRNKNIPSIAPSVFSKHYDMFAITPTVGDLFGYNEEEKHPDEASCAEVTESAPQSIMVNGMAATTIMNALTKFMFDERICYYLVFFSVNNLTRPVMATYENLIGKNTQYSSL